MGYFDRFSKGKYQNKSTLGKIWYFLWHEDSIESWLINIVVAFVLIKYLVYPGLGLLLGTTHPIVAVVSSSMHHGVSYDEFWEMGGGWYEQNGITKEEFKGFSMHNGFNKGDIMILLGTDTSKLKLGDIIVFSGSRFNPRPDPIIHRIVSITKNDEGKYIIGTKGDNFRTNMQQINDCDLNGCLFESDIQDEQIIGKAFIRVPYLGYVKIAAVEFVCIFNDFNFCIK